MAGGDPPQRVSLIVTVLDEAGTIERLLESIAAQTRLPDEVVFVDGGSTDGTWDILQGWATSLTTQRFRAPGASIARGRNLAIQAASGDLIAVTDAGVRLEPDWLEHLLSALTDDFDVVSGFFRADPSSTFERALGATVLPVLEDVDAATFLPSSRSVLFRRAAWAAVGGYPEWLDYCEDLVFDMDLERAGHRVVFAPRAVVWFRPRATLSAFFRQYYRYARGDGKAGLFAGRHLIRYATYIVACGLVWQRGWGVLALVVGLGAYTRRPYARLWQHVHGLAPAQAVYALGLVPIIRATGDVAKMLGYPVGVVWRLRRALTSRS